MGRSPLNRLEKTGVEHRHLARERGYLLERSLSLAAHLDNKASRLAPGEWDSDEGADLHQALELIGDVVPETVVDRVGRLRDRPPL
jgi:hypothetical protein